MSKPAKKGKGDDKAKLREDFRKALHAEVLAMGPEGFKRADFAKRWTPRGVSRSSAFRWIDEDLAPAGQKLAVAVNATAIRAALPQQQGQRAQRQRRHHGQYQQPAGQQLASKKLPRPHPRAEHHLDGAILPFFGENAVGEQENEQRQNELRKVPRVQKAEAAQPGGVAHFPKPDYAALMRLQVKGVAGVVFEAVIDQGQVGGGLVGVEAEVRP